MRSANPQRQPIGSVVGSVLAFEVVSSMLQDRSTRPWPTPPWPMSPSPAETISPREKLPSLQACALSRVFELLAQPR